jgi:hypothetical protein
MVALLPRSFQHLLQLGDAGRNLAGLILGHEIRRSAPARFRLELDIRHRETVGVADDVGDAVIFLGGPWSRKAAARHWPSIIFFAASVLISILIFHKA